MERNDGFARGFFAPHLPGAAPVPPSFEDRCACPACLAEGPLTRREIADARMVRVLDVPRVLAEMQALEPDPVLADHWTESSFRVLVWCLLNGAVYYAAPTERFCEAVGRTRAARTGCRTVVVEAMS